MRVPQWIGAAIVTGRGGCERCRRRRWLHLRMSCINRMRSVGSRVEPGSDRHGRTGGGFGRTFRHAQPPGRGGRAAAVADARSEEHTSELQSLMRISYAVFCLKTKNK